MAAAAAAVAVGVVGGRSRTKEMVWVELSWSQIMTVWPASAAGLNFRINHRIVGIGFGFAVLMSLQRENYFVVVVIEL